MAFTTGIRTIRVMLWKTATVQEELGRAVLDNGTVRFEGPWPEPFRTQVQEHGVIGNQWPNRVLPSAGAAFMDALLHEFSGGRVRAVED